jgi:hypothetical protein
MFYNRIARYARRLSAASSVFATEAQQPSTTKHPAGHVGIVMVPVMAQQVLWQAQLYRLAYERALADVAAPRHFHRFFSVWN